MHQLSNGYERLWARIATESKVDFSRRIRSRKVPLTPLEILSGKANEHIQSGRK